MLTQEAGEISYGGRIRLSVSEEVGMWLARSAALKALYHIRGLSSFSFIALIVSPADWNNYVVWTCIECLE